MSSPPNAPRFTNDTMDKFGFPETLVAEWEHWVLLMRPQQVTFGSLVLAAKSNAEAFGDLPSDAHAELASVSGAIEAALRTEVGYEKLNYLMLMMVDPHVHFHVIPRYEGQRDFAGASYPDVGWPGPPDLKSAIKLDAGSLAEMTRHFRDSLAEWQS